MCGLYIMTSRLLISDLIRLGDYVITSLALMSDLIDLRNESVTGGVECIRLPFFELLYIAPA